MNISAITSASIAPGHDLEKAGPAPASTQSNAGAVPTDTVTLSSADHKAAPSGDVDHDGDSH